MPLPAEGPELGPDCCVLEGGMAAPSEKTKPIDSLTELTDDDITAGSESLPDPERSLGRKSDDGASVAIVDPTGISEREDVDGL